MQKGYHAHAGKHSLTLIDMLTVGGRHRAGTPKTPRRKKPKQKETTQESRTGAATAGTVGWIGVEVVVVVAVFAWGEGAREGRLFFRAVED